ncbi:MAG: GHMP kinase [Clostridia bacterium]|nr:GHMP kinase [Clostridia bacterium]
MRCEEIYRNTYGKLPEETVFCPYRISPLGAHIDHQWGKVNGFAIDKGVYIAYGRKRNGVVELQSIGFPKRAQFHVSAVPDVKTGDWADHLRGATLQMAERYPLRYGISAIIEGTLPVGGLSSSAAVIIAFMMALARVNDIRLQPWETVMMAKAAENKYVGVNCGKLDQSCEILCRKDHLLYLDCMDDTYQLLKKPDSMRPFRIAVFFSGLERSLANSAYNLRQDECKAAAYSLMAYGGIEYGTFQEARLRNVPRPVFEAFRDRLPEPFRRRAAHFFSEQQRAQQGAEAWARGDIEAYGQLVFESGQSSIENYECGCPELISLYNIMRHTDGIYGGRFSGAGFKGCCMALVDPGKAERVLDSVRGEYLSIYPRLEERYLGQLCDSADGAAL